MPSIPLSTVGELSFVDERRYVEAASRRPQPVSLAPQSVTVIDTVDYITSPATTLADMLRYQAGIDVTQSRHGQYQVGIRGFSSLNNPRTLALYDGREFRFEQIGVLHWVGHIHQSDVDRIEIVKGPASVSYGANAFGGVISISRRPMPEEWDTRVWAQIGDHGLLEGDITTGGPLGSEGFLSHVSFKASLGTSHRDDLPGHTGLPPGDPHPRIASTGTKDYESLRATGTLAVDLPADHLIELEYNFVNLPTWDLIEDYVAGVDAVDSQTNAISARLRAPWGELRYIREDTDPFMSNQKSVYDPTLQPDYWYFQASFEDVKEKTRLQINQELGQHFLSFGGEYETFESSSNLWASEGKADDPGTWEEIRHRNTAVFIEDQWLLDERWALTAGIRYDDHNRVGDNVSPRVAINYQPTAEEFFRLSYSSGYRLPNSVELEITSRLFESSEDLEAETVDAVDFGWQRIYPSARAETFVNIFYNRANDLITFLPIDEADMAANWDAWVTDRLTELIATGAVDTTIGPSHFFEYVNLDNPQTIYGIELGGEWQPSERVDFTLWGNTTLQQGEYEDDFILQSDGFLASGPPALGGGVQRFQFDENLGKDVNAPPEVKINIGGIYQSGAFFTGFATRYVSEHKIFSVAYSRWTEGIPNEIRSQVIEEYFALDLSAGIKWGPRDDPDGFLRFAAMNILDSGGHYEAHEVDDELLTEGLDYQYTSEVGPSLSFTGMISF